MVENPEPIAIRERLILAGMYLSKYGSMGLRELGFQSFAEAYNVIGYALGSRPASIKNYRDEFDPLFPNQRKGWHKRSVRAYCLKVFDEYKDLDLGLFTGLIKSFVGYDDNLVSTSQVREDQVGDSSNFAKRLITGLAAEHYFESIQPSLPEFQGYELENTTRFGCGYDFRLRRSEQSDFLAVEVKGLRERVGSLSLTPKEYEVAAAMRDRFCLFVVKDFQKAPFHQIFLDPLSGALQFTRSERVTIQISWLTRV